MQEHPNKISVYAINSVDKVEVVQVLAEQLNFKNIKVLTDDLKISMIATLYLQLQPPSYLKMGL